MKPLLPLIRERMNASDYAEAKTLCATGIARYGLSNTLRSLFSSLQQECENALELTSPPETRRELMRNTSAESSNTDNVRTLRDEHAVTVARLDKPLIILGNGPSLGRFIYDVRMRNLISQHDTMGFNAAYREFERLAFWPTYYLCFDSIVVKSHLREFQRIIDNVKTLFLLDTDHNGRAIVDFESEKLQRIRLSSSISTHIPGNMSRSFWYWHNWQNTGCNAVQIGIFLGYKKILLLGLDSQYVEHIDGVKVENTTEIPWDHYVVTQDIASNPNYWFGDYQRLGDKFNIPQTNKYQTPAWELLGKSTLAEKIANCSSCTSIAGIRRESFEVELNVEISYLLAIPNLHRLYASNTEWDGIVGFTISCGKYIYLICKENERVGRRLYEEITWLTYINTQANPILYDIGLNAYDLPFFGYVERLARSQLSILDILKYAFGNKLSSKYNDSCHVIHCKAINVDTEFFIGKIIRSNNLYFLGCNIDGKLGLRFYLPQMWNGLIDTVSSPLIAYTTNIDIDNIPLMGTADALPPLRALCPGLSLIIRAKNEKENIYFVLGSLRSVLNSNTYNCEVVFVDNNSTDKTYEEVVRVCESDGIKNVFLYRYDIEISKSGDEHTTLESKNEMHRSLDTYYNWCLDKANKFNIVKWDADFVAINDNLVELLEKYDIANTNKKLAIWFSGKTLFKHGDELYVNLDTPYNEFRLFSKLHGYKWVYAPRWEICCPQYMETCEKEIFSKCVFLEVKDLGINEFENRTNGSFITTCARDSKDARIMQLILESRVDDLDAYEHLGLQQGSLIKLDFNALLPVNFSTTAFNKEECTFGELRIMQSYWLNDYSRPANKIRFQNLDNVIVQGLWVGTEISDIHKMCIDSFIRNGHCFLLYTYNDVANLPDGVVVMDANNIVDQSLAYKFNDSYAGFSDLFRYKLLYLRGGWYVDLDIYCLKRFDFSESIIFSLDHYPDHGEKVFNAHGLQIMPFRERYYVQTNPIKMSTAHPMIEEMYRICIRKVFSKKLLQDVFGNIDDCGTSLESIRGYVLERRMSVDFERNFCNLDQLPECVTFRQILDASKMSDGDIGQQTWNEIGPRLITEKVIQFGLESYLYDPIYLQGFIPYYEVEKYLDPTFDFRAFLDKFNVYSLDLFYTMWKNRGLLDKKDLCEGTFYKYLRSLNEENLPVASIKQAVVL